MILNGIGAINIRFHHHSEHIQNYEFYISCLSVKYAVLKNNSTDWWNRSQDNVSEWSDMSAAVLLFSVNYQSSTNYIGLVQWRHILKIWTCHNIAIQLLTWCVITIRPIKLLFSLNAFIKPGKCAVMCVCVKDIEFASIRCLNCSEDVIRFVFHLITQSLANSLS